MGIDQNLCREMKLPVGEIKYHYQLAKQVLVTGDNANFLEIIDTCTLANGKVLAPVKSQRSGPDFNQNCRFAAFVPSAGAATRYLEQLFPVIEELRHGKFAAAKELIERRFVGRIDNWCLPEMAKEIFRTQESCLTLSESEAAALCEELSLPKALFPCVREGTTFLQMKSFEHQMFSEIAAQVFIAPCGMSGRFLNNLSRCSMPSTMETLVFEQDELLSTIRLDLQGEPVKEVDGTYSIVPAGHGALVKLLPIVKKKLPGIDALFIRNVDNIGGGGAAAVNATGEFLNLYERLLDIMRDIRLEMTHGSTKRAAGLAKDLLHVAGLSRDSDHSDEAAHADSDAENERLLWRPMIELFHSADCEDQSKGMATLMQLYSRPLNLFGVVPNSGSDVGGTPVVVRQATGNIKICLEVPHASPEDCDRFFRDSKRATHFNPVFVAAELVSDLTCYQLEDNPFWLFTKKRWHGREVAYYETILFEILGNSRMANIIFLEVPRQIFNPHKTLDDTKGRSLTDWSFPAK